jgi:hypothetical protein
MKDITSVETLDIPSNVTVNVKARTITVEGPRGSLTKNTGHIQMDIQVVSGVLHLVLGQGGFRCRVLAGVDGPGSGCGGCAQSVHRREIRRADWLHRERCVDDPRDTISTCVEIRLTPRSSGPRATRSTSPSSTVPESTSPVSEPSSRSSRT